MIRFIYGDTLHQHPVLADTMFRDRAEQFRTRLKWDVRVDAKGHETDQYDALNPLYIIWENADGSHGGSMRVMPTVGRTMVNEHFTHLTDGVRISSPLIWECTRFCLAPGLATCGAEIAGAIMLAGHELGLRFGLEASVGVFDYRMRRIYKSIGWEPEIVGCDGEGRDRICVGLWPFSEAICARIADKAGVAVDQGARWFDTSFLPAEKTLAA